MNKKYLISSTIFVIVSIVTSILISSYIVANSIKSLNKTESSNVLTLSQVAEYLNLSPQEIKGIINTEDIVLENSTIFSGKMFPYIKINDKYLFYKSEIDEWLKDSVNQQRKYDLDKKRLEKAQ